MKAFIYSLFLVFSISTAAQADTLIKHCGVSGMWRHVHTLDLYQNKTTGKLSARAVHYQGDVLETTIVKYAHANSLKNLEDQGLTDLANTIRGSFRPDAHSEISGVDYFKLQIDPKNPPETLNRSRWKSETFFLRVTIGNEVYEKANIDDSGLLGCQPRL